MMSKRMKKPTILQQIMTEVKSRLKGILHDSTRKQYLRHTKAFVRYCREAHDSRSLLECLPYVQEYCDYLVAKGYTPPTVHTYIAAVCKTLELDLAAINKPVRHVADYVRGRSKVDRGATNDLADPRSLTVVYTYTLDEDATPPAGAGPDSTKKTKADGTTAPASVPSTKEALEASPAKKADHTPAAPPEGQDKGTSVTSSEGASEGAPTHRLGVIGDPSDGVPVASHEGAAATSHSSICGIPSLCREREKHSLQAYGRYGNVMLTDEEYQDIQAKLGEYVGEYVDHFSSRLNEKRYRCSDHHRAILSWWESDKDTWVAPRHTTSQHQSLEPGQPGNSFDTDDFYAAALERSFGPELTKEIMNNQKRS